MSIQLDALPQNVLNLIPISLRVNKTTLVFKDLPSDLQLKLRQYVTTLQSVKTVSGVFDYTSDFSEYSDWQEISNLTDLIIEYAKNWFYVRKGSYPFDPNFGTILYKILQTKDTEYQKQLLKNELDTLSKLIQDEFGTKMQIIKRSTVPIRFEDRTEYKLELQIKVLGRIVNIGATG